VAQVAQVSGCRSVLVLKPWSGVLVAQSGASGAVCRGSHVYVARQYLCCLRLLRHFDDSAVLLVVVLTVLSGIRRVSSGAALAGLAYPELAGSCPDWVFGRRPHRQKDRQIDRPRAHRVSLAGRWTAG
jgi:hypothetical protein